MQVCDYTSDCMVPANSFLRDSQTTQYTIRECPFDWISSLLRFLFCSDRYAATRGLFYSHMGWIFYKPTYERMGLVDREDLDSDPGLLQLTHKGFDNTDEDCQSCDSSTNITVSIGVFQNVTYMILTKFSVPLAIFFGFVLPTLLGYSWGDPLGAYIWGGLVSRLASECFVE